MNGRPTTLERAFELARSGAYKDVKTIERRLTTERYDGVHAMMQGAGLRRQLKAICLEASVQSTKLP